MAFTVTRDYNRSADNPFLPSSNNAGDLDCGDSLVEPCDPADGSGTDYTTAPGCNPLDRSVFVPAGAGAWTTPVTLADEAGADGAIVVFIESGSSSGAAWTSGEASPASSSILPLCGTGPNNLGAVGTISGPAGTKLTCLARCFDHVLVEARWQSGEGEILTTFAANNDPCAGNGGSASASANAPVGLDFEFTGVEGTFTCTIEIVGGGTSITTGSGGCIDP